MRKLLAANWKENPKSEKEALALFRGIRNGNKGLRVSVVVCPPFVFLPKISDEFKKTKSNKNLLLGAQDVFWEESGPFTGEVGPAMLKSLGARYAIIGHSERRKWLHETDEMINKKVKLSLSDGLNVILCVGEPLEVRRKGNAAASAFIKNQLKKDLAGISGSSMGRGAMTIAYEPIWAIGTGKSDNPADAAHIIASIKKELKSKGLKKPIVLYGGSVTSRNVADFVQLDEIDGALVGGASLQAAEFKKMIKLVAKVSN